MGTAIEIIDGRRMNFNEGSVEAERTFILDGFSGESDVLYFAFGNSVAQIGEPLTSVEIPKIGDGHPQFRSLLFCHAYDLSQLPGESTKWRATFSYRRTQNTSQVDNSAVGSGPGLVGFQELSARVSGSFVEAYRADATLDGGDVADVGGTPLDRAGVPTSVMRTQMEIQLSTTTSQFQPSQFAQYVGTRTTQRLFGINAGYLVYRGANIQRIETNKFTLQHTWLYDNRFHLIQEPTYNTAGSPKLGDDPDSEYAGKAYPVKHRQPFGTGDSHLLAPGF